MFTTAACPTASFSTTSAPTTSKTMATTARMSTNTSRDDCVDEAGQNTSTLVGDATAKPSEKQPTMPTSSQTISKRSMESAFSSDSSTSVTSSSSKCAKKKKKKKREKKVPTENHLKLRAAVDATRKWEFDLEEIYGLTDEQSCVCVSNLAPYLKTDTFPPSKGDRLMELAEEGWKLMKELHRLMELYPECGDQTSINGEWTML